MTTRNLLDYTDQTVFLAEQATGTTNVIQCVWVYRRAVDIDGLRRFHRNLQRGRLSRRIERSAIPFGRHRWVSAGDSTDLKISDPRPPADVHCWLAEQSRTPLDCAAGPGWQLAMLPLTDGGTVVSLVVSHCLADGVWLRTALMEAAAGEPTAAPWPSGGSRSRSAALREDLGQSARDLPTVGRALRAAVTMARSDRHAVPAPKTDTTTDTAPDEQIAIPTAAVVIDAAEWDAAVARLGGTGNVLMAGLSADLGRRLGRFDPADGTVSLAIPVADRTVDDTRANAVTNIDVVVDPEPATTDLRQIRAAIKAALARRRDVPDERWALLPLTPLVSRRLFRRMLAMATGSPRSVISSYMGESDAAVNRPDGTAADSLVVRSLYPDITRSTLHRAGGVLALLCGRVDGRVFISVQAHLPGKRNSEHALRQAVAATLDAFSLNWSDPWPTFLPTSLPTPAPAGRPAR